MVLATLAAIACLTSIGAFFFGMSRRSSERAPISLSFHSADQQFVQKLRRKIPEKHFHLTLYDPACLDDNTVNWYARFFFRAHGIIYMNPRSLNNPSPWVKAEIELARRFDVPVFELKARSDLETLLGQLRHMGPSTFRATLDNLNLIASTLRQAAVAEGFQMDAENDVFSVDPEIVMGQEQRDRKTFGSLLPIIVAWSAGYVTLVMLALSAFIVLLRIWPADQLRWLYA